MVQSLIILKILAIIGMLSIPIIITLLLKLRTFKPETITVNTTTTSDTRCPLKYKYGVQQLRYHLTRLASHANMAEEFYKGVLDYSEEEKFIPEKEKMGTQIYELKQSIRNLNHYAETSQLIGEIDHSK